MTKAEREKLITEAEKRAHHFTMPELKEMYANARLMDDKEEMYILRQAVYRYEKVN